MLNKYESNMNNLIIENADAPSEQLQDFSCISGNIKAIFRNHAEALEHYCSKADFVLGAIAWLTHEELIYALARVKNGCSIVVQKEDFLRPDLNTNRKLWPEELRRRYSTLRSGGYTRYVMPGIVSQLSVCGDPGMKAIRCVGNYNSDKKPAFPRMHNKFLVFCNAVETPYEDGTYTNIAPYAIWTGSFNLTYNATQSLENAVYIADEVIANAYANEWAQIYALSEPLDWKNEWIEPTYRIGT